MSPEEKARQKIDAMLAASGWGVQTKDKINLSAAHGVAIGELSFKTGEPDYTLFVDGAVFYVDKRERQTRKIRWEQLDEPLTYDASDLDRDVVAPDQIKTVLETFRDRVFTEMFPGRTDLPKTLIFAKDDTHADDIVRLCREVFGKGNDFCQKITYRTGFVRIVEKKPQADGKEIEEITWKRASSLSPEEILSAFRNSYFPRIAVTVDMIATGTDIKPLEIVFFMRSVASKNFFEQMKGRGVRVVSDTEMEQVNPGIKRKTRYVIVDDRLAEYAKGNRSFTRLTCLS